nr:nuclear transport factor 2 family protein [Sphingomonas sp. Y57]
MSFGRYEYLIDIVTKRYFDGVDNKNLDQVLDCFHEDSFIHEVTSNTRHNGRDNGIRKMFVRLMSDNGRIWHGNFVHTADTDSNAICSQFSVEIQPNGMEELRYENCNRFYLDGDKFREVYVYMSGDNLLK